MSEKLKDRLYQIIYQSDLTFTRLMLFLSEFVFGLLYLMPGETFQRSNTYKGLSEIMPEEAWGVLWVAMALLQLKILWTGRYHTRFAVTFAFVNMICWWLSTVSLFIHVWPANALLCAHLAICIGATACYLRSGYIPRPCRGVEKWT